MFMRCTNDLFPVGRLRDQIDRVFGDLAEDFGVVSNFGRVADRGVPALNVWEDGDALYVEAEVAGLTLDDVELLVQDNELTLQGTRAADEPSQATCHRRERGTGVFRRVLRLPVEIDASKVEATLRDGVLTIKLPKAEAARPRQIEVKAV